LITTGASTPTMSDSPIDYKEIYFQHKTLTKITGLPTYKTLAKLAKEIKANGQAVPSTLGGGNQGHLGLVCNAIAYERSSPGVPFDRPGLPEPPENPTAANRFAYGVQMKNYNACTIIEKTIIQQIIDTVEEEYLSDVINAETGAITSTVPEILQNLFENYGEITTDSLVVAKRELQETSYKHSAPISNLFNAINEYAIMAEAAGSTESPRQMIDVAMTIITRSTIFASDIRKWNEIPAAGQTWAVFTTHFKQAQKAIKRSQPSVTTDTLGYHEANATLVQQVVEIMNQSHNDAEHLAERQMTEHLANAANSTQHQQSMIDQVQSLANSLTTLRSQVNHQTNQSQGRGSGGRGGRDGRGGRGYYQETRDNSRGGRGYYQETRDNGRGGRS
jgi:hypothetical protein